MLDVVFSGLVAIVLISFTHPLQCHVPVRAVGPLPVAESEVLHDDRPRHVEHRLARGLVDRYVRDLRAVDGLERDAAVVYLDMRLSSVAYYGRPAVRRHDAPVRYDVHTRVVVAASAADKD